MTKKTIKIKIPRTHGICMVSVAPIRRKADDASEIVTQLLFGELITIVTKKNKSWVKVKCEWDDYVGWMDPKQLKGLTEPEYDELKENNAYAIEISQPITYGEISFPILAASSLPQFDGMTFTILNEKHF